MKIEEKYKTMKSSLFHKILHQKSQTKKKKANTSTKEFTVVIWFFLLLFLGLMAYFAYFQVVKSQWFINNSYNKRIDAFAKKVVRGQIKDRNGDVLAKTEVSTTGEESRDYPYKDLFSQVVGFSTNGKAGLESSMNFYLLSSHAPVIERVKNELSKTKNTGDNVVTTLDLDLQKTAYSALGNQDGAVIVMEPNTGKILAMISKPDYDPNNIAKEWDDIIKNENGKSELVNRATQGLYPPGSTFKIFTTLEYINENKNYEDYSFDCSGSITKGDTTIHCYNNEKHGHENLEDSFAQSCNSSFANIGLSLNISSFQKLTKSLLFNQTLPYDYGSSKSKFELQTNANDNDIMETAIGQGETVVTPLHMAMITSSIANDGELMKPYLVSEIQNYQGQTVKSFQPTKVKKLISKEDTTVLQQFMRKVVTDGTGKKLDTSKYTAYGKTGSAEYTNDDKSSHAWFVGYAHQDGKNDISVSIVVEGAGSGSSYAVPIAKKIFDAYYK